LRRNILAELEIREPCLDSSSEDGTVDVDAVVVCMSTSVPHMCPRVEDLVPVQAEYLNRRSMQSETPTNKMELEYILDSSMHSAKW
jgi:hypothetical protein